MKGIVVEITNQAAAVLSDEGCVVKVSNNNYQIGQEVEIKIKKQYTTKQERKAIFWLLLIAAFIFPVLVIYFIDILFAIASLVYIIGNRIVGIVIYAILFILVFIFATTLLLVSNPSK